MPTVLQQPRLHSSFKSHFGFTLVEMMVTLSVLAILLAIAAPSFSTWIERWRVNRAAADLESTLYFARAEAIRHGGGVSLVRNSGSSMNCTAASDEWQCGWDLVIDRDGNGMPDSGTAAIQTTAALSNVVIKATKDSDAIFIDRWGVMQLADNSQIFHFTARPASQSNVDGPKVCIKPGGNVQKTKPATNCPN